MINFKFSIRNYFYKEKELDFQYKNIIEKSYKLSKNKYFQVKFYKDNFNLFYIELDLNWRNMSHAGPCFHIDILGYSFGISIEDVRHWDYFKNKWTESKY
jgi:hypothetical protein